MIEEAKDEQPLAIKYGESELVDPDDDSQIIDFIQK